MNELIEDISYFETNFSQKGWKRGEYEACTFKQCDFSNADISNSMFLECEFIECDFSSANLAHSTFKESTFFNCKMMGLNFQKMSDLFFTATFKDCNLDLSSFVGRNLQGIQLIKCSLKECDFTDATLAKVVLDHCNLERAIFEDTVLEAADFRTAYNFSIDPERNRLKKAKFSKDTISGLLKKHQITVE